MSCCPQPFERPVPKLVVHFSSPLFPKDCVAVYSQDVVGAADSQTLQEEGELRLRVLAKLNATLLVTSVFCGFRCAPTLALATSNSCRKDGTRSGSTYYMFV